MRRTGFFRSCLFIYPANTDDPLAGSADRSQDIELWRLYSNENYRLRDKDKEKYLMVFLLQICCEKPDNDEYYKALLESLTQCFKIPLEAIANYIGVDVDGLSGFESSSDKDRIEKCIAHLFTTFIRNPSYSV